MPLDVVLLGKGSLAVKAARWFHDRDAYDLRAVVPVVPEPTWTDSLIGWAREHGVPHVESGHYRDLEGERVGLAVSIFYDKIIKQDFIESCDRIVNLHNGPLPRYRGMAPVNWALKNGESEHGVTLHEITPGIDDGPIVSQVRFSIFPEHDEVVDVYERCLAFGWTLFEQTMPMLDSIEPQVQDESRATYYNAADSERLGDRRDFRRP